MPQPRVCSVLPEPPASSAPAVHFVERPLLYRDSASGRFILRATKKPRSLRVHTSSLFSRMPTKMPSSHRSSTRGRHCCLGHPMELHLDRTRWGIRTWYPSSLMPQDALVAEMSVRTLSFTALAPASAGPFPRLSYRPDSSVCTLTPFVHHTDGRLVLQRDQRTL